MKNLFIKVIELIKGFFNWLERMYFYTKSKKNPTQIKFKKGSVVNYKTYMAYAVNDLGITPEDFFKYSTSGMITNFLRALQESRSFKSRDSKLQSDILSAFKAYITYIKVTK